MNWLLENFSLVAVTIPSLVAAIVGVWSWFYEPTGSGATPRLPLTETEFNDTLFCCESVYKRSDESNYEWLKFLPNRLRFRNLSLASTYVSSDIEAIVVESKTMLIVSIRGTETKWDLMRDFMAWKKIGAFGLKGHSQFVGDAIQLGHRQNLIPTVHNLSAHLDKPVVFTGHSLGAATATQLAALYEDSYPASTKAVVALCSPRSASTGQAVQIERELGDRLFRVTNCRDIVASVPPVWWGYRHVGPTRYLDSKGEFHETVVFAFRCYDYVLSILQDIRHLRLFSNWVGFHRVTTVIFRLQDARRAGLLHVLPSDLE